MSELYSCSRGFLIERHEDGTYTPFFVRVRKCDIIGDDGGDIDPGGGGGTVTDKGVDIVETSGWIVRKYTNGFFEATKNIDISPNFFVKTDGTDSELAAVINLPISCTEDSFCVNVTLSAENDSIATSFVNCKPVISSNKVLSIRISLRNLTYTFPNSWASDATYTSSKAYIRVSGK